MRQTKPPTPPPSWWLWQDREHPPALNMAIDQTLLQMTPHQGLPLLRFYGWDRPAVSIGYTQKHQLTARPGFTLVRRPTGGGLVYHDHDFTYSVIIPASHPISKLDRNESYRVINQAVREGLRQAKIGSTLADQQIPGSTDRAAMVCFDNPTRYDLLANGRKIAGSAQRRTANGILHQGSIHFDAPLPETRKTLAQALINGFRDSLGIAFLEFTEAAEIIDLAMPLAKTQYDSAEWNQKR